MEEMYYSCDFKGYTKGGKIFQLAIRPGQDSEIIKKGYLYLDPINPDEFYEVGGLKRLDMDFVKDKKQSDRMLKDTGGIINYTMPILFLVANCKPLMWICGRNSALFYKRLFGKKYKVEILRGSLSKNTKYPPLEAWSDETGGSKDEHIIKLSLVQKSANHFLLRFPKLMTSLYKGFSRIYHKFK